MSVVTDILSNEYIVASLVAGIGWAGGKLWGKRVDSKLARATTALATSSALMLQIALTSPGMALDRLIVQCKGVVAVQFAKAGFTEAQRAPFQFLIDKAIAEIVLRFVADHADRPSLTLPISAKVA